MAQPGRGFPSVGRGATNFPYTPKWPSAVLQPVAFPQQFLGPKQSHLPEFVNTLPHVAYVNDLEGGQQPGGNLGSRY